MKREPVAFAVEDDRAKPVWSDLVLRFEHLSILGHDGRFGLIQATVDIEVNQRSMIARLVLRRDEQAAAGLFSFRREQSDREPGILLPLDLFAKDGRVKVDGTIKVEYRNVHPDQLIWHDRLFSLHEAQNPRAAWPLRQNKCRLSRSEGRQFRQLILARRLSA
jgi:hypothetical protein